MIYYFSGTGNTATIARRLAAATNDVAQHICIEAAHTTTCEDSSIGLVFPVYGWHLPQVMQDFIHRLHISHPTPYIYMVCTCGDDIGHTARYFNRLIRAKQLTCSAAWSVQMPNTYIGLPGFQLDPPSLTEKKLTEAAELVKTIAAHVANRDVGICKVTEGRWAWIKSRILGTLFHRFATGDEQFSVSQACTHCGKCVKVCPMHNIQLDKNGCPQWEGHCANCLSCYHHCPHNAIQYGAFSKGKGQYRI